MKLILIIDPDIQTTWIMKLLLQREGFKVRCVSDTGQALNDIKKNLPDLIILDIQLGNNDGRAFCEYLGRNLLTSYIPVILTDYKPGTVHSDAFICKSLRLLQNPFNAEELLMYIRTTFAAE